MEGTTHNSKMSKEEVEIGKPISIVTCSQETGVPMSLNVEGLTEVFHQDNVKDSPIAILSVAGAYRTGKSFLLNYLLRYLRAKERKEEECWLKDRNAPLKGFVWKGGVEKATEGIVVWSRPFFLKHFAVKKKVAVFLMDTQGLFDDDTLPENANAMIALSTLLSSIQVYNVVGQIMEPHLKSLELFAEAGLMLTKTKIGQGKEQPFQRLIFLVRDWMGAVKHKYGEKGGISYLEYKLEPRASQPAPLRSMRQNIRTSFQNLECFLMPHPGFTATIQQASSDSDSECDSGSDGNHESSNTFKGQVSELTEDFVKKLEEITDFLFDPGRLKVKKCEGKIVTGAHIVEMITDYAMLFKNGKVPLPGTTRKTMLDEHNKILLQENMKNYAAQLKEAIMSEESFPRGILEKRLATVKMECLASFDSESRGTVEEVADIRNKLLKKIEQEEEKITTEYVSRQAFIRSQNEADCKEILSNSKVKYKEYMDEHVGNCETVFTGEELHDFHDKSLDKVITLFRELTKHMGEEKLPFEEDLRQYIDTRLQNYATENDARRAEQSKKHLTCLDAVSEALDLYIEEMDKRYDIGMKPTEDESLSAFHQLSLEQAQSFLLKKLKTLTEEPEEFRQKLSDVCTKELDRFRSKNTYNRKRKQEDDRNVVAEARFLARVAYKNFMTEKCRLGQKPKSPEEMTALHGLGFEAAVHKFQKWTQNCDILPAKWHDQINNIVSEEKPNFININNLNGLQNAL